MSPLLLNLWAIFQILLGFTFLIFIHELGHFLVAKAVGVRCPQFAIGFGQALIAYRKGIGFRIGTTEPELRRRVLEQATLDGKALPEKITESRIHTLADEYGYGETEYRFNWVFLGGYVKMVGQEDLDPTASSEDPRSFTRKPIWQRMAIISAGVIMNGLLAVILFIFAFRMGVDFPPAVVGGVAPDTPAARTASVEDPTAVGLLPGDHVVEIDGKHTTNFTSVVIAAPLGSPDTPIKFVVDRPSLDGGEARRLTYMLKPHARDHRNALPYVGIEPAVTLNLPRADEANDMMRASLAEKGLRPGMKITAVDGHAVDAYWQLDRRVQESAGKPVNVAFTDTEGTVTRKLKPRPGLDVAVIKPLASDEKLREDVRHLLGLVPATHVEMLVDKAAAKGILEPGDVIARIGEIDWPTVAQVIESVGKADGDAIALRIIRAGETRQVSVTPKEGKLGIGLAAKLDATIVGRVLPASPFAKLDVPAGSRVTHVAGNAVADFADIRLALSAAAAGDVQVTIHRPGESEPSPQTLPLTAEQHAEVARMRWQLDGLPPLKSFTVQQKAETIGEAVRLGVENTHVMMVHTYVTLLRLVQGWLHLDNLRGPIGIVGEGIPVTQKGFAYTLFFFALISINLAVINFLPLPIVDGGLAVLLILEKLRGRPLPPAVANTINLVGLLLIGSLFITLTYMDIARLVTGS